MNDLTRTNPAPNPFAGRTALPSHVSAGAVAIEQERAIAEAQGKLVIAKRFPRDPADAYARIMEACSRRGLADEALYSFPRGGQQVSGPSIRLAEELARCWGNIDYGLKELSRRDGESEMEAYAWDLQTNTYTAQKFTVKHIRDRQGGGKALTDERDIYEIGANMGARRMRARILAIIPGDVVDAAVAKVRETMKAGGVSAEHIAALVVAFDKIKVTRPMLEKRLNCVVDAMSADQLVDLRGIYKSINDGMKSVADWFGDATGSASASTTAAVVNAESQAGPAPESTLAD